MGDHQQGFTLVDQLLSTHHLGKADRDTFLQSVMQRESEVSTCLGGGLAIPHGELKESESILGMMAVNREGWDFDTPDGKPVYCMVLLAPPPDLRNRHLEVLAALARHIGADPQFQARLFNADSPAHAYEILHGEQAIDFNYLLEEIEAFTCGHTPYDDVTLLAASWSP